MKIEVLGKPTGCQGCTELKMLLDMQMKEYTFYDVAERGNTRIGEMKKEMMARGLRSLPIVFLDGKYFAVGDDAVAKAGEM